MKTTRKMSIEKEDKNVIYTKVEINQGKNQKRCRAYIEISCTEYDINPFVFSTEGKYIRVRKHEEIISVHGIAEEGEEFVRSSVEKYFFSPEEARTWVEMQIEEVKKLWAKMREQEKSIGFCGRDGYSCIEFE
jgi:hypothetical protein